MNTLCESVRRDVSSRVNGRRETAEELWSRGFDDVLCSKTSESLQFCKSTLVRRICADDLVVAGEGLHSVEAAREGLGVHVELVGGQGLGQHVGDVVVGIDVPKRDGAVLDVLVDEVESDCQVSGTSGELILGCEGDGCRVVCHENGRLVLSEAEFCKEATEPNNLAQREFHRFDLSFGAGE